MPNAPTTLDPTLSRDELSTLDTAAIRRHVFEAMAWLALTGNTTAGKLILDQTEDIPAGSLDTMSDDELLATLKQLQSDATEMLQAAENGLPERG